MGRNLDQVLAALPKARRHRIEKRFEVLKREVESLSALREVAGKAQTEVAAALNISQPSVSKVEKQTDVLLSTLRHYVQALGGELEIVVRLPRKEPLQLSGFGDLFEPRSRPEHADLATKHRTRTRRVARRA